MLPSDRLRSHRIERFDSTMEVDPDSVDFSQGRLTAVGYTLRGQRTEVATDGGRQKLSIESFRNAVATQGQGHGQTPKWIWGHGLKAGGGLCSDEVRDDDLTLGTLKFELNERGGAFGDGELIYHAQSAILPKENGNIPEQIMWARFMKMKSGTVGQNSIGLTRKAGSTRIRGVPDEDGEDDSGMTDSQRLSALESAGWSVVSAEPDYWAVERTDEVYSGMLRGSSESVWQRAKGIDPKLAHYRRFSGRPYDGEGYEREPEDWGDSPGAQEWYWFEIDRLWECSPVTWGLDSRTPMRDFQTRALVIDHTRTGATPAFDTPVFYQDANGAPRPAIVQSNGLLRQRRGDSRVLLSDLVTGEIVIRQAGDLCWATQPLIQQWRRSNVERQAEPAKSEIQAETETEAEPIQVGEQVEPETETEQVASESPEPPPVTEPEQAEQSDDNAQAESEPEQVGAQPETAQAGDPNKAGAARRLRYLAAILQPKPRT